METKIMTDTEMEATHNINGSSVFAHNASGMNKL